VESSLASIVGTARFTASDDAGLAQNCRLAAEGLVAKPARHETLSSIKG
jgi:hypothetical protein